MPDYTRLEDMPLAESRLLKHDDPLIDDYAARVNDQRGFPKHLINGIKNGGERSESLGANSISTVNGKPAAQGIMQMMPNTALQYGLKDRTDPKASIDAAADYIAAMKKNLNTDRPDILSAGYNGGYNRQSLRDGVIPPVPEMQEHAKRTVSYMDKQNGFIPDEDLTPEQLARQKAYKAPTAAPVAVRQNDTIPDSDLTPEQLKRQSDWVHSNDNPVKRDFIGDTFPLSDSTTQNVIAGAQKGLQDMSKGLGQIVYNGINGSSNLMGKGNLLDPKTFSTDESEVLDKPLARSWAGGLGNAASGALASAMPYTAVSKIGAVRGAAQALKEVPAVGGALSKLFPQAVAGATLNAASPINSDEGLGTRTINAGIGGMAPIALHSLGALGKWAAGKAADGAKAITPDFVSNAVKSAYDSVAPKAIARETPAKVAAAQSAFDNGIPVYPKQLQATTAPIPLNPKEHAKQAEAFSKAVIKNDLGENTANLGEALASAREKASANYNNIYRDKVIPVGNGIPALKALQDSYLNDKTVRFDTLKNSSLAKNIVADAIHAAEQKPSITGDEMQSILSTYSGKLRDIDKSIGTEPDKHAKAMIHGIVGALSNSANKVLSPEEQALLKQTNNIWRNTHQLEPLLANDLHGVVSPSKYANAIRNANPNAYVYGKGNQTQSNLAKFGSTFMTDAPKVEKEGLPILDYLARHPITTSMLGSGGAHLATNDEDSTSPGHLGKMVAGAVAGRMLSGLGHGNASSTNRMLSHELSERTGALADVFGKGNLTNAAVQGVRNMKLDSGPATPEPVL